MILTIEGTVLETPYGKYEDTLTFDEFAYDFRADDGTQKKRR